MKRILLLFEQHNVRQKDFVLKEKISIDILKSQIEISKDTLQKLKVSIRNIKFKNHSEEIYFFKQIKPNIYADFIFYTEQLRYLISKPNTTNPILKNYIKNELKKIEGKKRKNIKFYRYIKQKGFNLDNCYFLRENKQLEIFDIDLSASLDNEFYTSHDTLAAEVIAYELLTNFYKKEIKIISNLEEGPFETKHDDEINSNLNWTSSKTDLVELIYALKVSGAINGGAVNIKELIETASKLFNIDISNFYKTYSEIKNRGKERTKFLNTLVNNLKTKLEYDDSL
jgi:hypothetical protein